MHAFVRIPYYNGMIYYKVLFLLLLKAPEESLHPRKPHAALGSPTRRVRLLEEGHGWPPRRHPGIYGRGAMFLDVVVTGCSLCLCVCVCVCLFVCVCLTL